MTTGQLRRALCRAVLGYDPTAARKRRERAQKDARVETWSEVAGTAALAGRDLPPAEVLAADKQLTADASALKAAGADGSLQYLRARVYLARLAGQPLHTLLPAPPGPHTPGGPDGPGEPGTSQVSRAIQVSRATRPARASRMDPEDRETAAAPAGRAADPAVRAGTPPVPPPVAGCSPPGSKAA